MSRLLRKKWVVLWVVLYEGQYLYISPENDTVIVRSGTKEGAADAWIVPLYQIAVYAGSQ